MRPKNGPAVTYGFFCCWMVWLALAPASSAQTTTGDLFGEVTDNQGEPLPGVTLTLSGPAAPRAQVTNANGQFRFLGLPPGGFEMRAKLDGFSTVQYPNVGIRAGRNTTIEVQMSPAVEEEIRVTTESPLLDARKIQTGNVDKERFEALPTARDPWAVLASVPTVQVDRINLSGGDGTTYPVTEGDVFDATGAMTIIPSGPQAGQINIITAHQRQPDGQAVYHFFGELDTVSSGPGTILDTQQGRVAVVEDWLVAQNARFHGIDVFRAGPSPVLVGFVGADVFDGFQNTIYTGGVRPSFAQDGNVLAGVTDVAPEFDPTTIPPGLDQWYDRSRLTAFAHDLTGGQPQTKTLWGRPGMFGPDFAGDLHISTTEVLEPGTYVTNYPRGPNMFFSAWSFANDSFQETKTWTEPLDTNLSLQLATHSDPIAGTILYGTPNGYTEFHADGARVGLGLGQWGNGDFPPQDFEGRFASDFVVRGDNLYQLANYDLGDPPPPRTRAAKQGELTPAFLRVPGCLDSDDTFCGQRNRFAVTASWEDRDGNRGSGHARALTGDSGTFWFFNQDNRELLVKTLDACVINGHFWFFAGGLTDVGVHLEVKDTRTQTIQLYDNDVGNPFASILDTTAFPCDQSRSAVSKTPGPNRTPTLPLSPSPEVAGALPSGADCGGAAEDVCLADERFRVEVDFTTRQGQRGTAVGGQLANETGVFWFFESNNFELMVKVLDGCAVNDRYWFFGAGLTDVAVDLKVTDTSNGTSTSYSSPLGTFEPITDISAFATCP